MKRDFRMSPPDQIRVECFDRSRDVNGNPTAHYLLTWSNGLTGPDYQGGRYRTRRRVQVGYRDHMSGGAIGLALDLFPGTAWDVKHDSTFRLDRRGDGGECVLERDADRERVPVLFRAEKGRGAESVTAVFPTLPADRSGDMVTVYAHVGQHSAGSRGWYDLTRPVRPGEADALRRELESLGYVLDVCQRWTATHDARRRGEILAQSDRAKARAANAEAVAEAVGPGAGHVQGGGLM